MREVIIYTEIQGDDRYIDRQIDRLYIYIYILTNMKMFYFGENCVKITDKKMDR